MIKLIIFDLDGVLVESRELHYIALNKALFSVYNEMAKDQSQSLANILGEFMKSEDL